MKLLIIRHAIAEDREAFKKTGESDDLRPLTDKGREKMRAGVRGLRRVVPKVSRLASSPLVRAAATAQLVSHAYGGIKVVHVRHLKPGAPVQDVLKWLHRRKARRVVVLIGHEPQLSVLASWLLTGLQKPIMELKKGSACLLELDESMRPGRARLLWSLAPGQLRALGREGC